MTRLKQPNVQLAGMLLIAVGAGIATWIGVNFAEGLISFAIVTAFTLVVHFGRQRSDALMAISGVGDERAENIGMRAAAFTGIVLSFVLPAWWCVTLAQGDPNETLNILCAVGGFSYIGAAIFLSRRS